jgi:hypothetical protein
LIVAQKPERRHPATIVGEVSAFDVDGPSAVGGETGTALIGVDCGCGGSNSRLGASICSMRLL